MKMTNEELLRTLLLGDVDCFNNYRKRNFSQEIDFSGADFSRANIQWANLSGIDLQGANFQWAYLAGVDFTRAKLSRANFQGANLSSATFPSANLLGADFTGAKLWGTSFSSADLTGAIFGDDLSGVNFWGAKGLSKKVFEKYLEALRDSVETLPKE